MKKHNLKRIFTMSGEYSLRNYTIKDLRELKGHKKLSQILTILPEEAEAAESAGVDLINTRFDFLNNVTSNNIRSSAPHTFMSFVIPLLTVPTKEDSLRHSFKAMELGADSIIYQGSLENIETLSNAGIPVQGHVGLVPKKSIWTGGLKAYGKTINEVRKIFQDIKDLENAGAWAVECEVIPSKIMDVISKRTSLVTISLGSGIGGDVQLLFAEDILGDSEGPFPRHSKQYCDIYNEKQKIQKLRISAFKDYIHDIQIGNFPSDKYEVKISDNLFDEIISNIDL
jgi:3-methyl-2-oxobutanoate hydroxymethyltransferase